MVALLPYGKFPKGEQFSFACVLLSSISTWGWQGRKWILKKELKIYII